MSRSVLSARTAYIRAPHFLRTKDMKTVFLCLLAIIAMAATSCAVRGHANHHSTGAGVSTPIGGLGGSVRY
jgi:hypothetical protein